LIAGGHARPSAAFGGAWNEESAVVGRPEERKKNPTRERLLTLRCLACGSVARMERIRFWG